MDEIAARSATTDWTALPAPIVVQKLGARVAAIPRGRMRQTYLRDQLATLPAAVFVRVLACAQREAAAGGAAAAQMVELIGELVSEELFPLDTLREVVDCAVDLCEHGILSIFRGVVDDVEDKLEAIVAAENIHKGSLAAAGETLGRRKSIARIATGDLLDRVMLDPHPHVIRNALLNTRMDEDRVVRFCSRRPIAPVLLEEASRSRFQTRTSVRRTLVFNPFTPVHVASRFLPALTRTELLQVAHDETLDALLREAARNLLEQKPPRSPRTI
jgi:hypothetical protein